MNRYFTNSNQRSDFLRFEMEKYSHNNDVLIAVAFFTNEMFIKKLVDNGCTVKLIVRLGYPTDGRSLKNILNYKGKVQVRYYTSTEFHPKLYMFGHDIAFLGSSNLTDSGLMSNQELNIAIDSDDAYYGQLFEIFEDYWVQASVLTEEVIQNYISIVSKLKQQHLDVQKEIFDKVGKVNYSNIVRVDDVKRSERSEFEANLLKRYQTYSNLFEEVKSIYSGLNFRKVPSLPIRIEIDQFFNWLRDEKAYQDQYKKTPILKGIELKKFIESNIQDFFNSDFNDVLEIIIDNYKLMNRCLSSTKAIVSLTEEDLSRCLISINAFNGQIRHHKGGRHYFTNEFIRINSISRIKDTFIYLLHGNGNHVKRMADCIYDPKYKLKRFGHSCVQELFGWVNTLEAPICNERTYMCMQYLGFGKL
ncbi:phospholipase D-like domain-containing protein [Brevibacillus sp. 179-C9.3 HS]|uniref:phospholipase D-like domain-containing protein n=1 Tax=unclassified Brevibacillus TaxID=2684853 RepID=UPI0039A03CFC